MIIIITNPHSYFRTDCPHILVAFSDEQRASERACRQEIYAAASVRARKSNKTE